MQPKAFKRNFRVIDAGNAEFSLFYCASCARLNDLYKASISQLNTNNLALFHPIAKISVTSPIIINMPTRELLAGETKNSFV